MWSCQEEDERQETKQCRPSEGRYRSNLNRGRAKGRSTPCHSALMRSFMKGAPTKGCVHIQEHTFQKDENIILLVLGNILNFRGTEFRGCMSCKP